MINLSILIFGVNLLFIIFTSFLSGDIDSNSPLFLQLVVGSKSSFMPALISSFFSISIGILSGVFCGYFRGMESAGVCNKAVSLLVIKVNFIMDVIDSLPKLITVILCYLMFNKNMFGAIVILGIMMIPSVAASIKERVVSLRQHYFIEALKCSGISDLKIIWYHILWCHCKGYILSSLAQIITICIVIEAGLNFVLFTTGNGCSSGSWGCLLAHTGKEIMRKNFTSLLFAVWIFLTIFSLAVIADRFDKMTAS